MEQTAKLSLFPNEEQQLVFIDIITVSSNYQTISWNKKCNNTGKKNLQEEIDLQFLPQADQYAVYF